MTGGQDSKAFGKVQQLVAGLGVNPDHIRTVIALKKNHEEFVKIIQEEVDYDGVSVIIPTRECVQTMMRRNKSKLKK
jgi:indolepyruvate ferredoxin oxidoreductase alpha subunit